MQCPCHGACDAGGIVRVVRRLASQELPATTAEGDHHLGMENAEKPGRTTEKTSLFIIMTKIENNTIMIRDDGNSGGDDDD